MRSALMPGGVATVLALTMPALAMPALAAPASAAPPPPLPAEQLTVATLPPPSPHRLYVFDYNFDNEIDARVHVFDGDSYRQLGQIDAGFGPGVNLSPDGATTVVATTYFARGSRGARTDLVEFTDNSTLTVSGEIVLPSKRTMTTMNPFIVAYSADQRFLYVSYMTPAASLGVLDPAQRKVLSEIDTAGCVLVIPSGPNRVSSICESGTLLTITHDAQGHETARAMSAKFFDADTDPVFVQGIPTPHGVVFLSFLGEVHEVNFSGAEPAFAPPWSLVSSAERGQWRPGAAQVGAIQHSLGRLYVPMHRGGEGTHKDGGTEIWVYDLASHKRLARWPLPALAPVYAVNVSQDAAPLLFAGNDRGELAVIDALSGQVKHVEKHIGQPPRGACCASTWLMLHP
jgi:methylamine dehydrogenase heavy chain